LELDPVGSDRTSVVRRWRGWILVGVIGLGAAGGVYWFLSRGSLPGPASERSRTVRVVPEETRIRIEVLNATDIRGLARQATFYLRDAGFDVVYFGNTNERSDWTIIRDHTGHAGWASLAVRAMPGARIEARPDSSHFLDLTVLVGRNWMPPRQTFYP
jgi:hypothetical protein